MPFVHLHTHTHYSFLQGLGNAKKLIARAKELEMSAIALTDAGNLYGAFEFYKYAKDAGLKPIIGVEFTYTSKGRANKDKDNATSQLVLLAQNIDGYRNLINLVTASNLSGFYFKPRIDAELLAIHSTGLIALSGNHLGEIAQHVTTGRSDEFILDRIAYYQGLFGTDKYFLEIIDHPGIGGQERINDTLIRLSRAHGIPLVATNDTYYLRREDAETQDLLSCIGDGRSIEDPDRMTRIDGDYSLRASAEMEELFAHVPEAIANTERIADMIDLVIPYGKTLIPEFELDEALTIEYEAYLASLTADLTKLSAEEWNLRRLCYTGLNTRYEFGATPEHLTEYIHKVAVPSPDKKLSAMSAPELIERGLTYQTPAKKSLLDTLPPEQRTRIDRLEYELTVVDLMGFNGYFCIVADFINWAKDQGIPVGPGRGSAAGAILAYLSGITDIDPLPYWLLFERFLNPARVSMPDIDVDFADEDRDRVLEYVRGKYGAERVAQICTFGTMAARAAVKDAGKALGIPFSEMNALAALIPARPGTKLADALEESVEFKVAYQGDERYRKIIDHALRLEGTVRQLGVHACAVIIAPEAMTNYCALQHPPKDTATTVTQLSQYPLEDLGLLKMDFLGLRNLTIMKRCLRIIRETHGVEIDLLKLRFDDKKVFKVFAEGDTTGVFQFESSGMRKYLRDLAPNVFEDIIVMVSLYRPGPLAYIPTYIERKHGREKVSYPHPSLEAILRPTQGIAVYQEQIMQLVQAFAGFSLGEADILRRAIGKKKMDLLMEQKEKFITAANGEGHSTELAKYIFEDIIEPFAGYGFNKSHAACYSMISYQTAYLKAYYPTEFMTALMVSDEDDTERITMEIGECAAKGIEILPPDINESKKHFTYIDRHHIRFGLKAIKGLGNGPIESIQKGRVDLPYETVLDFLTRTSGEVINKKSLEALILSGALDRFGERASLLESVITMTAYNKEFEQKTLSAQTGLFDLGGSENFADHEFRLAVTTPMNFESRLAGEKSSIGYSVSGHGLDGLAPFITRRSQGIEIAQKFLTEFESSEAHRAIAYEDHGGEESGVSETPALVTPTMPVETPDIPVDAPKKEREKQIKVRYVGLITSVRKVQTKTGKLMGIAVCEGVGITFSMVVFPKDYELLGGLLIPDQVAIVEGYFKGNPLSGEISVIVETLKTHSITKMRELAQEMQLFDPKHRVRSALIREANAETSQTPYLLDIPKGASLQDLLDLKSYMGSIAGATPVHIRLSGEVRNTKLSVSDPELITAWWERRWKKLMEK